MCPRQSSKEPVPPTGAAHLRTTEPSPLLSRVCPLLGRRQPRLNGSPQTRRKRDRVTHETCKRPKIFADYPTFSPRRRRGPPGNWVCSPNPQAMLLRTARRLLDSSLSIRQELMSIINGHQKFHERSSSPGSCTLKTASPLRRFDGLRMPPKSSGASKGLWLQDLCPPLGIGPGSSGLSRVPVQAVHWIGGDSII